MVSIFDSLVKIYDDEKNTFKGMGFIIKEDDDTSYILTCNHVVYSSNKDKKLTIRIDKQIEVKSEDIIYGHELKNSSVDLALLKVKSLENKIVISLQRETELDSKFELKTLVPTTNDKLTYNPKSIKLHCTDLENTSQYVDCNSNAYLFSVNSTIKSGYSGSPIVDTETNKVIGILNMEEKELKECKGLAIENVLKIFPEIETELEVVKKKTTKITR